MKSVSIIGGGLWGGLLALRLFKSRPDIHFTLFEKNSTLGGTHTWSFHETDVSASDLEMLKPMIRRSWDSYDVLFPSYKRTVGLKYHSITSDLFHQYLTNVIPAERIKFNTSYSENEIENSLVIDTTQILGNKSAYQHFLGLELKLKKSHGLKRPVLMDATVDQLGEYRFIYLLPWDEKSLLVEDTRYSPSSEFKEDNFKHDILSYAKKEDWEIDTISYREQGSLILPYSYEEDDKATERVHLTGIFNDITGYSLPDAVRVTELLIQETSINRWAQVVFDYKKRMRSNRDFYCLLNRLMFRAALPEERYRMLEFFYRSNESSISKFYAGRLSSFDRLKFFFGRPPVSVIKGIKTILENA